MPRIGSRFSLVPLRARLLLLVLLAVVPAWGLMLYSAGEHRRTASLAIQQDALRLARITAVSQDRLLEGARQLLIALTQVSAVRSGAKACADLLGDLLFRYPGYANLGVIAPTGEVTCSALPSGRGVNAADRLYFRRAIEKRGFAIGEYQIGRITGRATVNFGYPIVDDAGEVRSVVFAALELAWLNRLAAVGDLPAGATLSVIDHAGVVLARHPDPEPWIGKPLPEAPLLQAIKAQSGGGTAEASDADGVLRLYGFSPLPSDPGMSVILSIGIPKSVVFAQVDRVFRRSLIGLAAVALLALAAAWIGGDAFILRQVRALVEATGRLAAGDLSARTAMRGRGELNQLARAFDDMAATLQQREEEARRAADEIRLLQSITMEISTAENLHAALATVLKRICETTGWALGEAWTPTHDGTQLICSPGWHAGAEGLDEFRAASTAFAFPQGVGLPGRVWSTRTPIWLEDVTKDPGFLRASQAEAARLKAGLGIPVLAGDEVVAVMAFFMFEPRAEDQRLVRLATALGTQLGTVIQRKRAEDRVRHLAYFDALTDLPNRAQLDEALNQALAAGRDRTEPLALLILALERFKDINNTLGQSNGNLLLRQIGPRVGAVLRQGDSLAHLGGSRFAILMPRSGAQAASETAERILRSFEPPFDVAGFVLDVGATIGIAVSPGHGDAAAVLMRRAEVALDQAQRSGAGFTFYSAEADVYNPRRLQLMGELRSAIAAHQLVLYCQPKLDLRSGQITAMEALVRWQHPTYGLVAPDQFVPFVETTGLIAPLTEWILEAALIHCHAWEQRGVLVPVAVNLSTRNLTDPKLIDHIANALVTWGGRADWLDLEITESAIMANPRLGLEMIGRLKEMGFRLFVDDFGTGYSSLAYLQKLPVDGIKIDKSFVLAMLDDHDAALIVQSTVELGHNLGLKVIAEGVENQPLSERLAALGCDEAQGYYVSRPMPADQFATWIETAPWPLGPAKAKV